MRIFIAGATGVLGCRVVPTLTAAGQHVTARRAGTGTGRLATGAGVGSPP